MCADRLALAGLLLTAGCAGGEAGPDVPAVVADGVPIHTRIDLPSITACGGCHQDVYREWAASLHHGAWINDNVLAATRNFTKEGCRPCHSPMPVLPHGLELPPEYRPFNQDDGVHCLSCHGLEDGVAAARTIADAPCRPRYEPKLLQAGMCWPCHEPTHQAFSEYQLSDARAVGVRCADCHMQPAANRPGRSHGANGGMNPDFVARALAFHISLADGVVQVELRNRCGHKFPGEIPSRAFVVRVDFPDREPVYELLRKPNKEEARADNRLLPDEERVLRFPLPKGVSEARVRLLWKPLPLLPEEQSFVLAEWSSDRANAPPPRPDQAGR